MSKRNSTPNSKSERKARRHASKERRNERRYGEIRKDKGLKDAASYKRQRIQEEKKRFEKNYNEIQTFKRTLEGVKRDNGQRLSDGEVRQVLNKAIRFLYSKGLIKSSFQYYEDFLEQHKQDLDINELIGLIDEAAESEQEAHEEVLSAIQDPNYGKQFVRRKRSGNGYMTSF